MTHCYTEIARYSQWRCSTCGTLLPATSVHVEHLHTGQERSLLSTCTVVRVCLRHSTLPPRPQIQNYQKKKHPHKHKHTTESHIYSSGLTLQLNCPERAVWIESVSVYELRTELRSYSFFYCLLLVFMFSCDWLLLVPWLITLLLLCYCPY